MGLVAEHGYLRMLQAWGTAFDRFLALMRAAGRRNWWLEVTESGLPDEYAAALDRLSETPGCDAGRVLDAVLTYARVLRDGESRQNQRRRDAA